jgi:hypothetical protein
VDDPVARARFRRNLLWAALPTALVPAAIGLVMVALGADLALGPFVAGSLGWLLALALRAPVAVVANRLLPDDRRRVGLVVAAASGPLEEIVRLGVVLLVGSTLGNALSIGLGWASIEVVYGFVNGVALLALAGRTDPEAEQARALLPLADVLSPAAPFWGILERAWASLLHVSFTLLLAAQPLLVVVTIALHSATNLAAITLGRRLGMARLELAGLAWSVILLTVATWPWRS